MNNAVQAVGFALAASFLFSAMHAIVRSLSADVHAFEIAFFRSLVGLFIASAILAPRVLRGRVWLLRPHAPWLMLVRGVIGGASMVAWFYGIAHVPLAEATALSFTSAIFASLGAVVFLRESMGARRWSAVGLGFLGALLILRPGVSVIQVGALVVLASSIAGGINLCVAKVLLRHDTTETVVFWLTLVMTLMSAVPAAMVWTTPSIDAAAQLVLIGVLGTGGTFAWTHAMTLAEATVVIPVDYMRLVWAAALGFVFFAEVPDIWTWSGGLLIVVSTLYIALREAYLGRRARRRLSG